MDVAIAALAAASQFVTAYMGWRMSTHPPRCEKEARKYERCFLAAGALGIVAIVWAAYNASIEQTKLRAELRHVTGADNIVWLHVDLKTETDKGFQLFTSGCGSIAGGSFYIVPAHATDAQHPDYRKGMSYQFLALHSGVALDAFLPRGDWRIEFVSLTTGHYNQFLKISQDPGGKVVSNSRVVRGGKEIQNCPPQR